MSRLLALIALAALAALAACTGGSASATVSARATASAEVGTVAAPVRFVDATLAEGAAPLQVPCEASATELCNALDDDCDGRLDEDAACPYAPGEVHVVVAWNSDADLDLYLTEPSGTTASFQSPSAASGLEVQHAGRGACVEDGGPGARTESARIATDAPRGTYALALHYLMECDTHGGATTALVTVSVGGAIAGTWTYTLTPNERVELLRFDVD